MLEFNLKDLRKSLDILDEILILLLAERFRVTDKIGDFKAANLLPAEDKRREREKLSSLKEKAASVGVDEELVENIYRLIFERVKKRHRQKAKDRR